jgi:hypothetical protein
MLTRYPLPRMVSRLAKSEGTELIEFAVSLPLLVVLVVGIYDFGSALTLKHRLNSAVREGARIASSQHRPLNLAAGCGAAPPSVCIVRDVVHDSLLASNVDDCGLGTAAAVHPDVFTWAFNGTCTGLRLEISRATVDPTGVSLPSPPFDPKTYLVENSQITLTIPYQWQFRRAFDLLSPNTSYLGSNITVSATMQNLD